MTTKLVYILEVGEYSGRAIKSVHLSFESATTGIEQVKEWTGEIISGAEREWHGWSSLDDDFVNIYEFALTSN